MTKPRPAIAFDAHLEQRDALLHRQRPELAGAAADHDAGGAAWTSGCRCCSRAACSSIAPRSSNGVTIAGMGPHHFTLLRSMFVLLRSETMQRDWVRLAADGWSAFSRRPPSAPKKCSLAAFKVRPTGWPGASWTSGPTRPTTVWSIRSKNTMLSWPVGSTTLTVARSPSAGRGRHPRAARPGPRPRPRRATHPRARAAAAASATAGRPRRPAGCRRA